LGAVDKKLLRGDMKCREGLYTDLTGFLLRAGQGDLISPRGWGGE
jgi:hypothetical protein